MRKGEVTKRVGLESIDVTEEEAKKEGYETWTSDKGNVYAVAKVQAQIPEEFQEVIYLLHKKQGMTKEEAKQEAISLVREIYLKKYVQEPLYKQVRKQLKKELSTEVKEALKSLKEQASAGLLAVPAKAIDNIDYEYKTSKDKLYHRVKELQSEYTEEAK